MLLLTVGGFGAWQLEARERWFLRGWELEPQPVADTGMNPACVVAAMEQYDLDERARMWDALTDGGFVWLRQRFDWAQIEPQPGHFEWAQWDAVVAEGVARGVQFIAVLDHPPDWAGSPPDPLAFADFAAAFANHYQAQMVYYQILHNPNLAEGWDGEAADAAAYAELLAQVSPAIRAADPDARIILGSLAPTVEQGPRNFAEPLFLEQLYVEGAAPYFDVVAVQPYGFQTGPDDRRLSLDLLNFSRPLLVREVMEAHGDGGKALWASDFGWNSLPPGWDETPSLWGSVDEATQARYTVEALERIEREWPWMGVACINNLQPRPRSPEALTIDAETHWGFALLTPDGQPRPLYAAVQAWNDRPRVATPGVWPAATPYAHYEGAWRLGPLGADIGASGDKVRFTFRGTDVALTVRRGPYRAFLFVTVDGEPAPALPRDEQGRAYVVLYDPLAAVATVPLAEGLPDGVHTVEVIAERGWYRWALADWRVVERPPMAWYHQGRLLFGGMALLGAVLTVVAARRTDWAALLEEVRRRWKSLPSWVRLFIALLNGLLFSLGAWMSWAQGLFRRLGEGREMGVVVMAALLFYLSPWALLTLLSGGVLFALLLLEPSLGLALTMAAAPFYLQPLSLFGKSFALSELLLLMTTVAFALQWALQEGRRFELRDAVVRASLPVLLYIAVGLLSSLHAAHRHEALREFRLVVVEPSLLFLLMMGGVREWRARWRVLDFWLLGGLVVAFVGLGYFALGDVVTAEGGAHRLRSIYGSPNNVALYLGRLLPFLVAALLWGEGRRRWLYGAALLPLTAAFFLTLSRGGILLGLPAALVVMGWLAGGRWRRATVAVLALFALAVVPLFRTPRFASLLDLRHGTTFLRLSLWRSAWTMAREHPWLGVGPDNFLYAYRTRYVLPSAWEEFNLSHPHNVLLDWLTRLGVAGTALFFWLEVRFWRQVVSAIRTLRGAKRALALGMAGAMAEALAHGLVDAAFFYVDLAYVFFLLLALAAALKAQSGESAAP